jgi:hypothetical protein
MKNGRFVTEITKTGDISETVIDIQIPTTASYSGHPVSYLKIKSGPYLKR